MITAAQHLTLEEFDARYGLDCKTHEFWYGEAMPKSMPAWLHGKLQKIIMRRLDETGFESASEVELRVVPDARPRPDIIAFKEEPDETYPTTIPDVIVEIASQEDKASTIRDRCQKYEEWGCKQIYVVYPAERRVILWSQDSELSQLQFAYFRFEDLGCIK